MASVEVALVGDVKKQPTGGDMIPPIEFKRPYAKLRKARVDATDATTLGELVRDALERLGAPEWQVNSPSYDVGFYRPEDDAGVGRNFAYFITLVDDDGRARWTAPVNGVPYGEVVKAAEAGAVKGDPSRIHVAMTPQVGDGAMLGWVDVVQLYELLKGVIDDLAALYGSYELVRKFAEWAGKATETLDRHSPDWQEHGANPYSLDEWLDEHAWDPEDVGRLLGCTRDEAEAVLWALGFGEVATDRWMRNATEEAKLMDGNQRMMLRMGAEHASPEELRTELRSRIEETLESGQAPPPPDWQKLPWMETLMMGESPSVYTRAIHRLTSLWYRIRYRHGHPYK